MFAGLAGVPGRFERDYRALLGAVRAVKRPAAGAVSDGSAPARRWRRMRCGGLAGPSAGGSKVAKPTRAAAAAHDFAQGPPADGAQGRARPSPPPFPAQKREGQQAVVRVRDNGPTPGMPGGYWRSLSMRYSALLLYLVPGRPG